MNKNNFVLKFDKTITRLAGYPFGESVYMEQISKDIDFSSPPIFIEFPPQIVKAASSFTQGFFKEFVENFGYNCIDNQIKIITANESLIKSIKENLM